MVAFLLAEKSALEKWLYQLTQRDSPLRFHQVLILLQKFYIIYIIYIIYIDCLYYLYYTNPLLRTRPELG